MKLFFLVMIGVILCIIETGCGSNSKNNAKHYQINGIDVQVSEHYWPSDSSLYKLDVIYNKNSGRKKEVTLQTNSAGVFSVANYFDGDASDMKILLEVLQHYETNPKIQSGGLAPAIR